LRARDCKEFYQFFDSLANPAAPLAGFPLRSSPDESGSPLRSDKLDAGNALAVQFRLRLLGSDSSVEYAKRVYFCLKPPRSVNETVANATIKALTCFSLFDLWPKIQSIPLIGRDGR